MLETSAPPPPPPESTDESLNWSALIRRVSLSIAIVTLGIFLIGLYLAFSNAPVNAPRIQVIREVLTTILLLLSIVVITALALLILQIIRLVSTIRHETKPILDTTRETLIGAKGSVEFVSKHVSEPIIRFTAWSSGLWLLIRDLGGIRRAIQRHPNPIESQEDIDA
jgi:hypothetical protein